MKLTFTKYKDYKASETVWLGSVPTEWAIVRNKEIFKERSSLSTTGKEILLTVSHITGITPRSEKNVNMFMAETMEGYKICHPGDLIINTMWAWMGALGTSNELGICSPSYNVYMPIKGVPYNHRYFDYLFRIPNAIVEMTRNSKGIVSSRLRLYAKDFFQIETVLPSLREQKAIALYLDNKTAQIDHKIDLLTQKATRYGNLKQSLINKTVTRGLDRSVPMKDSAIEWLGEIPEHWEARRLKDIFTYTKGYAFKSDDFIDSGIPVVKATDIKQYRILEPTSFINPSIIESYKNVLLKNDDVVISTVGSQPHIVDSAVGQLARIDEKTAGSLLNQSTLILRIKTKRISNEFLYYILISKLFRQHLDLIARGTANQSSIKVSETLEYLLFLPTFDEQKAIADYLDTKTAQLDQIIQTINTQIEKLKELRKTLINDVVTGKIKVIDSGA